MRESLTLNSKLSNDIEHAVRDLMTLNSKGLNDIEQSGILISATTIMRVQATSLLRKGFVVNLIWGLTV